MPADRLNICVTLPAVVGRHGRWRAMHTAAALARLFAEAGEAVTLAVSPRADAPVPALDGVRCVEIVGEASPPREFQPHLSTPGSGLILADAFYHWLKGQSFDIVYVVGGPEVAMLAVMARAMALGTVVMPVVPVFERCVADPALEQDATVAGPELLLADALERDVLRHAASLVAASSDLAGRLERIVPGAADRCTVLPVPAGPRPSGATGPIAAERIDEVVFFGRCDAASGFWLFCDAIEALLPSGALDGKRVTFLGPIRKGGDGVSGRSEAFRADRWGIPWAHVLPADYDEALAWLEARRDRALVVAPFLAAASPGIVADLMAGGHGFLTTDVAGLAAMIAPADAASVVAPTAPALAARMATVLAEGVPVPRPADGVTACQDAWTGHARKTIAAGQVQPPSTPARLSILVLHRNRPNFLNQALAGLEGQMREGDEIVLIDNASDTDAARAMIDDLASVFAAHEWPIVRLVDPVSPALARNAGIAAARGDAIVFLDDDNCLTPGALETYRRAIASGGFDLVCSPLDCFDGDAPPADVGGIHRRQLFAGHAGALAFFSNAMGDTNMVISRAALDVLGGFPDPGYTYVSEDWLLFALARAEGLRIGVLPESVVQFREEAGRLKQNWKKANHEGARHQVLRVLGTDDDRDVRLAMLFAQGLFHRGGVSADPDEFEAAEPAKAKSPRSPLRRLLRGK